MPQDVTIKDIISTRNANVIENKSAKRNELAVSSITYGSNGELINDDLSNLLYFRVSAGTKEEIR